MFIKFSIPKFQRRIAFSDSGEFPCPHCQVDRTFDAAAIHETTGLLGRFVPGVRGRLVDVMLTCRGCGREFPSRVRDRPLFADRVIVDDAVDQSDSPSVAE